MNRSGMDEGRPGDTPSMFELLLEHFEGDGVLQSDERALEYLRKAADDGYASAQFILDSTYWSGQGAERSDGEVAKRYRKATDRMCLRS